MSIFAILNLNGDTMFNTLKSKLLAVFLSFTLITALVVLISLIYIEQKQRPELLKKQTVKMQTLKLQDTKVIDDFFAYEIINPSFFETGESRTLKLHDSLTNEYRQSLKFLQSMPMPEVISEKINFSNKFQIFNNYTGSFDSIVSLIQKRGFKDYGVVGQMRSHIHKLETTEGLNLSTILMLRRHEKDYIIRNQTEYIGKLNAVADNLQAEVEQNANFSPREKQEILNDLDNYRKLFMKMVELDSKIGIRNNTGLKGRIDSSSNRILQNYEHTLKDIDSYQERMERRLRFIYLSLLITLLLFVLVLSFRMSDILTRRLSRLSGIISTFVKTGFRYTESYLPENSKDEIGQLVINYNFLQQEIVSLIDDFKNKVDERTEEVTQQRDRIEEQRQEIMGQRDELYNKNRLIQKQKQKAEYKTKELLSSIYYAKRIQEALLPNAQNLKEVFPESFVFYQPKDIVSGDFYNIKRIKNKTYNLRIIVVADCTGHGVPGAFMSMLGISFINEIVERKRVISAADILDSLRSSVTQHLQNEANEKQSGDGMDVAVLIIDEKNGQAQFAGASRPLFLYRKGELSELKGDRMSIGKNERPMTTNFTNHLFPAEKGDAFYLLSDGYVDQFGGESDKKLLKKKLKKLILKHAEKPMREQQKIFSDYFFHWKGNRYQTDDVLLAGVRYI